LGSPALPPLATWRRRVIEAVASVATLGLAGCGDEATPEATSGLPQYAPVPSANPYDISDPAELADVELQLARTGSSCADLRLWYEANAYDSNVGIARHFYEQCGATPPPVLNGELTLAQVAGGSAGSTVVAAPPVPSTPPAPPCATEADISVSAEVIDVQPTDDGLDGYLYKVATTATNQAQAGASVIVSLAVTDASGGFLDYENATVDVEASSAATTTSYELVTYDGRPADAAPTELFPGDPPFTLIEHHPCL
jgi:hypothetical protein